MNRAAAIAVIAAGLSVTALAAPASAGELLVAVTGVRSAAGEVGCALFAAASDFPSGTGSAAQWRPAQASGVTCRFDGLKPGVYAVAVFHDVNGNRRTDTNLVGIPTEDYGFSNNARPAMRAPRFDEAAVQVKEGAPVRISVRLGS